VTGVTSGVALQIILVLGFGFPKIAGGRDLGYDPPDIVNAILNGGHPPELTARRLMNDTRLPLDWNEQRRSLGFALAP
jgi:hypothetical protein